MKLLIRLVGVSLIVGALVLSAFIGSVEQVAAQTVATMTPAQTQAMIAQLQAQIQSLMLQLQILQLQQQIAAQQNSPTTPTNLEIKVTLDTSTFVQGEDQKIRWSRFNGDFDFYAVYLGNHLVPGNTHSFLVKGHQGIAISKNKTSVIIDGRDISDNFISTWLQNSNYTINEQDLRNNFYIIVRAEKDSVKSDVVAEGKSQTISISKQSTAINAEISGKPTLSLQYNSANKEASLRSVANVVITAGKTDIYLPTNNPLQTNLFLIGTNQSVNVNNRPTVISTNASRNGNYYVIPAGSSTSFTIETTFNPNELFAGSYRTQIGTEFYSAPGANKSEQYNTETSNQVAIIGERAPYISTVNGKNINTQISVEQNGLLDLRGVRLNGSRVYINNKQISATDVMDASSGQRLYFNIGNLSQGRHLIQLENAEGKSNKLIIEVIASPVVATSTIPSITLLSPNGGERFIAESRQVVSWRTENIDSSNKITIYIIPTKDSSKNMNLAQSVENTGSYMLTIPNPNVFNNRSSFYKLGEEFKLFVCASPIANNNLCATAIDYSNGSFTIVSASTTPVVSEKYYLTIFDTQVQPNASMRFAWETTNPIRTNDWVGVFKKGASNKQYLSYTYIPNATVAGSGDMNINTPSEAGDYELRYFKNNGYDAVATSKTFKVVPLVDPVTANLKASVQNNQINLTWNNEPNIQHLLERRVGAGEWSQFGHSCASWSTTQGKSSCVDRMVVVGTTYQYRIRYIITAESSIYSTPVTVTLQTETSGVTPPTLTFTADKASVALGESVVIRWNPSNVDAASCRGTATANHNWGSALQKEHFTRAAASTVQVTQPTTFTITCKGLDGSTISRSVTINVSAQTVSTMSTYATSILTPRAFFASVAQGWNFLFDELVARGW